MGNDFKEGTLVNPPTVNGGLNISGEDIEEAVRSIFDDEGEHRGSVVKPATSGAFIDYYHGSKETIEEIVAEFIRNGYK